MSPKISQGSVVRAASGSELDEVYLLGFDSWSTGDSPERYLVQCRNSEKYRLGKWYLLELGGSAVSALICYRNAFGLPEGSWGIGSLATKPECRGRGHASALMRGVLDMEKGPCFLHSDIDPRFYSRFDFRPLPKALVGQSESVLMLRGEIQGDFARPAYF